MREKILELIKCCGWPTDRGKFVEAVVTRLQEQVSEVMTPELQASLAEFKQNLSMREVLRMDRLCDAIQALLSEEEIDQILAFYHLPVAAKAASIGEALDKSDTKLINEATPQSFITIMQEAARAFMVANTEGEVAASIARMPIGESEPLPEAPPPPEAA